VGLTPPPPSSAEGRRKSRAIPLLTLWAFVAYKNGKKTTFSLMARDISLLFFCLSLLE